MSLRALARLHEIYRRLYVLRLRRYGMIFIASPGIVILTAMLIRNVIAPGVLSISNAIGATILALSAGVSIWQFFRAGQQEIGELEEERRYLKAQLDVSASAASIATRQADSA